MLTIEINLNFGRRYGKHKKTDNAKTRLLMLELNTFGCIVFERRVGQYYMCMEILLYSAILFTSKFTDHVIAAWRNPRYFQTGKAHSPEREVKKKYLNFVKPIRFGASLNFNHTNSNIEGESKLIYMLGHLEGSSLFK